MTYLVVGGILLVLALGGIGFAVWARERVWTVIAAGLVAAFVLTTLAFSATTVDARAIGIQTSFGKYQGTLSNGFHLTAPWSNIEQFSTQVQYLDVNDVPVSFAGGGGGTVNATIRWTINADKAQNLWQKYREFDLVRDRLVQSSAKDAVRTSVAPFTPTEAKDGANLAKVAEAIKASVQAAVDDDGVNIDSVSVTNVALDSRAQESLNRIVEATSNVERAKAEQERAVIDNTTAELRQQSLTPEANLRYCLELVNNWNVEKNGNLPATFNCGLGGDTPVIVGQ